MDAATAPEVLTDKPALERLAIAVMVTLAAEQLLLTPESLERGIGLMVNIAARQIAEEQARNAEFVRDYVRSAIKIRRPIVEALVREQPGYVPALVAAGLALEVTDTAAVV